MKLNPKEDSDKRKIICYTSRAYLEIHSYKSMRRHEQERKKKRRTEKNAFDDVKQ